MVAYGWPCVIRIAYAEYAVHADCAHMREYADADADADADENLLHTIHI